MQNSEKKPPVAGKKPQTPVNVSQLQVQLPLTNYTLSSECPACGNPTVRRACKVRCERCGFVWDCSEL